MAQAMEQNMDEKDLKDLLICLFTKKEVEDIIQLYQNSNKRLAIQQRKSESEKFLNKFLQKIGSSK